MEKEVALNIQAGWRLQVRVTLIPIFYGSDLISITGHFEHLVQQSADGQPMVPISEAEELMHLSSEAIDNMNDMLTVFRNQTQLLLLKDLPMEVRNRLEVLENLTLDNSRLVRRTQHCVGQLSEKCRQVIGEYDLWRK